MDAISFIIDCLTQVQIRLLASCDNLTREQVLWRPTPHANNIGFILWHLGRGEDNRVSSFMGDQSPLWVADGWYEKFGQSEESPDPGDRMGLQSLAIPELDVLIGYLKAAHDQTMEFLDALTSDDLYVTPDRNDPEHTMAVSLRHMITHKNNHHGQIDYIRGLQDENWDLPPGTGAVLKQ